LLLKMQQPIDDGPLRDLEVMVFVPDLVVFNRETPDLLLEELGACS
jgi:hypothetical protein